MTVTEMTETLSGLYRSKALAEAEISKANFDVSEAHSRRERHVKEHSRIVVQLDLLEQQRSTATAYENLRRS